MDRARILRCGELGYWDEARLGYWRGEFGKLERQAQTIEAKQS